MKVEITPPRGQASAESVFLGNGRYLSEVRVFQTGAMMYVVHVLKDELFPHTRPYDYGFREETDLHQTPEAALAADGFPMPPSATARVEREGTWTLVIRTMEGEWVAANDSFLSGENFKWRVHCYLHGVNQREGR